MFFELEHHGNDSKNSSSKHGKLSTSSVTHRSRSSTDGSSNTLDTFSKRDLCLNALGGCTYDAVYNLQFASAYFVCEKDGYLCGYITKWPWYYISAELVNISAAAVTQVSGVPISDRDGGPFYVVRGDEKTWISNGTRANSFDFQRPQNYSSEGKCVDELEFHW